MAVELSQEVLQSFQLDYTKNRWVVPTNGAEQMVISAEPHTTWGAAVLTLYRTRDGVTPYQLESAQTLAGSGAAGAMSATIDCSTVPAVMVVLTTVGTAGTYANLGAVRSVARL